MEGRRKKDEKFSKIQRRMEEREEICVYSLARMSDALGEGGETRRRAGNGRGRRKKHDRDGWRWQTQGMNPMIHQNTRSHKV